MPDKQVQRGGGEQYQAAGDIVVYQGAPVEEVVRAVTDLQFKRVLEETTAFAREQVETRVQALADRLLEVFQQRPELAGALADPDFQLDVRASQVSAARSSTDDEVDMLVSLLTERAASQPRPRVRLATRRALEIVGQVSPEALTGLSLLWYAISLVPTTPPDLDSALAAMNHVLDEILKGAPLPEGDGWLDDLGILDCVQRGVAAGRLKSFHELVGQNKYPGFICVGFDTVEADDARQRLNAADPGLARLVIPHPFEEDRYVLSGGSEVMTRRVVGALLATPRASSGTSATVQQTVDDVIARFPYGQPLGNWEEQLVDRLGDHNALMTVDGWWRHQRFGGSLAVTAVGIAVAYANVKRLVQGAFDEPLEQFL